MKKAPTPVVQQSARTNSAPSSSHTRTTSILSRLQNASQSIGAARPQDILALQRVAGNRAVMQMMQAQKQSGVVMRRSDKLPVKATLVARATGGKKLFGATGYDKVLNEIHTYHTGIGDTALLAQLQQIVVIAQQLLQWEVSHGLADAGTASKDAQETVRRQVMTDVKTDFLPKEAGDVFTQARTAAVPVAVPVPLMQSLMEVVRYDGASLAKIEPHYATALRGYNASGGEIAASKAALTNGKAKLIKESGIGDYKSKHDEKKAMEEDPTGGQIDVGELQSAITGAERPLMAAAKRVYQENVGIKAGLQNMDSIEFGALKAYSGHVYGEMNAVGRNSSPSVKGASKKARQVEVERRNEAKHLNLMSVSALNKLPVWGGRDVYRGEDISWDTAGEIAPGNTMVFKSLSSTSRTRAVAENFATGTTPAVWVIHNITASGRDITSLAMVQQTNEYDQILSQMASVQAASGEDEILLLPYTRVRVNTVTNVSGKTIIDCTAVGG